MFPIKDTIPRTGFPAITWGLILLNAIIFLYEISIPKDILREIFYLFGLVPAKYSYPQWASAYGIPFDDYLSFLTNIFLHAGWLHIVGNMWFLHLFGSTVEDHMGHWQFLIFYLLSGITASAAYFMLEIHSKIPAFGASGAIAGVMGAYILMFPRARILTLVPIFFFPLFFELSAFFYIGFWFILQLFSGTLSLSSQTTGGGVAWWGHVGGFIAGIAYLPLFWNKQKTPRKHFGDENYRYLDL